MFKKANTPNDLPADEYLNSQEIFEMNNHLVEKANALIQSSLKAMDELTKNQEIDPDELDVAVSESNRELSLRLANRERRMLRKIRYALDRIQEGEYGMCVNCGVPIGFRRLKARPVATLCIDCKTQQEQLERRSWSM